MRWVSHTAACNFLSFTSGRFSSQNNVGSEHQPWSPQTKSWHGEQCEPNGHPMMVQLGSCSFWPGTYRGMWGKTGQCIRNNQKWGWRLEWLYYLEKWTPTLLCLSRFYLCFMISYKQQQSFHFLLFPFFFFLLLCLVRKSYWNEFWGWWIPWRCFGPLLSSRPFAFNSHLSFCSTKLIAANTSGMVC